MGQGRTISGAMCVLLACTALLIWLGLSGIQRGDELEGGSYASRQIVWLVLGAGSAAIAWALPYQRLKPWSYPFYVAAVALLVAVYFFPAKQGARRWIPVGPLSVQPSELAKLALILALGHYLMFRRNHRTVLGLIPPFAMTVIPVLLILKEPDLGTSLLFFPVLYAMLFIAGAKRWHLMATVAAGIALLPVLWICMSAEQKSRVTAVFQQHDGGKPDPGDGYHLYQSKQLLALGGTWGSELNGMPLDDLAAYRLPAGRTDFVYCLVGERYGLWGTLGTLAVFSCFVITGLHVAAATRDPFGRLLATGIVAILTAQVLINTSMTVGLSPITGLTLPLMSYGGSSLVTTAFSIGLLLNIARSPGFDVAGQPFQFGDE
ncbi:FtsW/RodA/SpoVE family cell cycle protein [Planctomicrobium piriforme]|uniref:Cell wall polymerase n=1 Tax=Planctomicrobium piriforme TaxID=1576369 RepID=A0A1I3DLC5_9PLAN|nr:FtsW/RodA/SpoVE family cell cycle protein [Planctomicrobium piriforme]SFH87389.1 rod shape determining protein RodA [Planctomicrobium piriforme]